MRTAKILLFVLLIIILPKWQKEVRGMLIVIDNLHKVRIIWRIYLHM